MIGIDFDFDFTVEKKAKTIELIIKVIGTYNQETNKIHTTTTARTSTRSSDVYVLIGFISPLIHADIKDRVDAEILEYIEEQLTLLD